MRVVIAAIAKETHMNRIIKRRALAIAAASGFALSTQPPAQNFGPWGDAQQEPNSG